MKITWTKAQEDAIAASGRTILVSAAAGSGKTATLTEKIIRSIKGGASLSKMLIVTFTRSATADMREKISKALASAIAEDPTNPHLYGQMVQLGSANISTIDSFCMKPVRENFAQCKLPSSFRIADAAELDPIKERVFNRTVDEFFIKYGKKRGDGLFDGLFYLLSDNDFADLVDSLSAAKGDSGFKESVLEIYSNLQNYTEGIEIINKEADELYLAAEKKDFFLSPHGRALLEILEEFVNSAIAFYTNCLPVLAADETGRTTYYVTFADDLELFNGIAALIKGKQPYSEFVRFLNVHEFPKSKSYKNPPVHIKAMKATRDFYADEYKKKWSGLFSTPDDELVSDLYRMGRMCEVLYDFLKTFDKSLLDEKRERGVVDFADNKLMLYSMLYDDKGELTPLAKDYAQKYDFVAIDEYQDVDEIQDKIFAAVGTDHRFMVGDIKQSIYGFRGAVPKVFSSYRTALPELNSNGYCATGNSIFMSENFRCNEPVIATSNAICSHLFKSCPVIGYTEDDDLKFAKDLDYSDYTVPKVQFDFIMGSQKKKSSDDDSDTAPSDLPPEAINLANRIAELLRGEYYVEEKCKDGVVRHTKRITPSDITILVPRKNHIPSVKAALAAMNIPTVASEIDLGDATRDLLSSPEMIYLLNLLRVINNPSNDIALLELLGKAPVCGSFSLDEIVKLRQQNGESKMRGLYYSIKQYGDVNTDVIADKCRLFTEWLDGLRELTVTHSAEEILQAIKTNKFCYCGDSDAFRYMYEKARSYRQASFVSLYSFLNYFEKHIVTEKKTGSGSLSASCVNIMTIHASKGLEFPVCFIYGCGILFSSMSIRKDLLFTRELGVSMPLFYRTGKNGEGSKKETLLRTVAKLVITRSNSESEIQNLYVAMTRAREFLFISASPSDAALGRADFEAGDRYRTLACNCHASWLTAGYHKTASIQNYCDLNYIDSSSIKQDAPLARNYGVKPIDKNEMALIQHYKKLSDAPTKISDEEKFLRSLPTKAPASKLKENMLDRYVATESSLPDGAELGISADDEDDIKLSDSGLDFREKESILENLRLMKSSDDSDFERLIGENKKLSAAQRGTMVHAFLQYCDFDKFISASPDADLFAMVREEISRLILYKFIEPESETSLDVCQLVSFFKSQLFSLVKEATDYKRELRFNRFVPLSTLTSNPAVAKAVGDKSLYVQGSIDLVLHSKDGGIIICDYKSDRIPEELKADRDAIITLFRNSHGDQLKQYSQAIFELYGKFPEKIYIYSLRLGEAIEIKV